jgi:small-conductance mechanosensitive channel
MPEQFNNFTELLNTKLGEVGDVQLSLGALVFAVLVFCATLGLSVIVRQFLLGRLLERLQIERGARYAILALIRYFFLCLGLYLALITAGFNLTTLTVLLGALGVGLGFGLQNIFQNFMSGLIILFERPIKVGDFVDLGDLSGMIQKISIRSTTIRTNDNVSVIVPNSEFVSSRVVNWSHGSPEVRMRIPVGVAYGSDTDKVRKALLEVAAAEEDVLEFPEPAVFFRGFGDSSLNFELGVWRKTESIRPVRLVSDLNFAIDRKFREYGITIPFPQRDLHIISDHTRNARPEDSNPD